MSDRDVWTFVLRGLRNVTTWTSMKSLGDFRVLRTSYFWLVAVPVVARVIVKLDHELTFDVFGERLTFAVALPFSWGLFYFSSLAFAVATGLYFFSCPDLIKDYETLEDFRKDGSQLLLMLPLRSECQARGDKEKAFAFAKKYCLPNMKGGWESCSEADLFNGLANGQILLDQEHLPDAYQFVRAYLNESKPVCRYLCAVCYLIGFILLLWVFGQSALFVVRAAFLGG